MTNILICLVICIVIVFNYSLIIAAGKYDSSELCFDPDKNMDCKAYISGPITGTDDYMERFGRAERELATKGYSVVNPAKVNAQLPSGTTYEEYMKMSFCMLDMCEAIYMLNGWGKSCGANRELGYALAKDMIIIHE